MSLLREGRDSEVLAEEGVVILSLAWLDSEV